MKTILTRNVIFSASEKSRVLLEALAGKKGGAIFFALIFFVTFFYQEKKVNKRHRVNKKFSTIISTGHNINKTDIKIQSGTQVFLLHSERSRRILSRKKSRQRITNNKKNTIKKEPTAT